MSTGGALVCTCRPPTNRPRLASLGSTCRQPSLASQSTRARQGLRPTGRLTMLESRSGSKAARQVKLKTHVPHCMLGALSGRRCNPEWLPTTHMAGPPFSLLGTRGSHSILAPTLSLLVLAP